MNGGAQSLEHVDSRKKTQMITVNHAQIRTRRKVAGRAPVAVQPALSRVGSVFGPALILVPSYCGEELLPPGVLGDGVLLPLLGVALPGLVVVLLPESEAPPAVPAAPLPPEAPLVAVADLLLVVDFLRIQGTREPQGIHLSALNGCLFCGATDCEIETDMDAGFFHFFASSRTIPSVGGPFADSIPAAISLLNAAPYISSFVGIFNFGSRAILICPSFQTSVNP